MSHLFSAGAGCEAYNNNQLKRAQKFLEDHQCKARFTTASRFITGIDVFYNDNFINLMSVMKSAVSKYGRPKVLNFDNGKSYKNKQMELLAARIGTTLSYCQPYTPTSKAKIERWFRTLKDQWMAGLDMRDFRSLDELRGSLYAYVQSYNLAPHSSLRGMSPQDRFFSEPDHIRCLTQDNID